MKQILTFLLLALNIQLFAQTNPITSITISLPANPDANTANWGTGGSQLTITANSSPLNGKVNGLVAESKVLVIIKKGGAKICGSYTSGSAPSSNFNTLIKVWNGPNASALLGQGCTLPPGDYELSVQFFINRGAVTSALSEEKTKAFTIRGNEQQAYQAPQSITPANATLFSESDFPKPINFRWTPLIPRPQEPVTYRLRVWQLMQGQNGTQARTVNQPIMTRDVDNLTQALVSNLISGPCKSPYLCDFVWNVQALNREGKPIGGNNGTSETFSFGFSSASTTQRLALVSPANGSTVSSNDKLEFRWLQPMLATSSEGYKIKIVEIAGDQSPEQALRTNKPIFEKDSMNWLHTNKPIFERDSMIYIHSSSPSFGSGKRYAWNVQALNRDGKPIGGNNGTSETFSFKVSSGSTVTSRLILLAPANGSTIVPNERLEFKWLPPAPLSPTDGYKITIVEILGAQSPEQAFKGNKPIFERDSMNWLHVNKPIFERDSLPPRTFKYPSSATPLKAGSKYGWAVQALTRDGKPVGGNGSSEVFTFNYANTVKPREPACDCGTWSPINVQTADGVKSFASDSKIAWNCRRPFNSTNLYLCSPNEGDCLAKMTWEVKLGNTVVRSGSGSGNAAFTPVMNGIYMVTLNAVCNGIVCKPFVYTVVVTDCNARPDPPKNEEKTESKKPVKRNLYYSMSTEYSSEVVLVQDTLFFQVDNNYSSGSNQLTYTISNLSNNKTSRPAKLAVKNNEGLVRIALPIQNSQVGKGEIAMMTVGDAKKYYYLRFKRY